MPRKFFKRYMPEPETFSKQKALGFLAKHLSNPALWTLTRNSVAGAFSVGLFMAFIPVPFQMPMAAMLAILFRVNLPISVGMVWVTNPITMAPIMYACYLLGSWLMDLPLHHQSPDGMLDWITNQFSHIWKPLLVGCLVAGISTSILSNIAVRLIWRWHISSQWNQRQLKRLPKLPGKKSED